MRLCKDCRHYSADVGCQHESNVEASQCPISGRATSTTRYSADTMRYNRNMCGPNAALLEPHVTIGQWCAMVLMRVLRAIKGR